MAMQKFRTDCCDKNITIHVSRVTLVINSRTSKSGVGSQMDPSKVFLAKKLKLLKLLVLVVQL